MHYTSEAIQFLKKKDEQEAKDTLLEEDFALASTHYQNFIVQFAPKCISHPPHQKKNKLSLHTPKPHDLRRVNSQGLAIRVQPSSLNTAEFSRMNNIGVAKFSKKSGLLKRLSQRNSNSSRIAHKPNSEKFSIAFYRKVIPTKEDDEERYLIPSRYSSIRKGIKNYANCSGYEEKANTVSICGHGVTTKKQAKGGSLSRESSSIDPKTCESHKVARCLRWLRRVSNSNRKSDWAYKKISGHVSSEVRDYCLVKTIKSTTAQNRRVERSGASQNRHNINLKLNDYSSKIDGHHFRLHVDRKKISEVRATLGVQLFGGKRSSTSQLITNN